MSVYCLYYKGTAQDLLIRRKHFPPETYSIMIKTITPVENSTRSAAYRTEELISMILYVKVFN